jgi:hypothetical protein
MNEKRGFKSPLLPLFQHGGDDTRKIWKYRLEIKNQFELEMPKDALILAVQVQDDMPCIWAMVNPANDTEIRTFRIIRTGHSIADGPLNHIGTFQLQGGAFIGHVFEVV